MRCVLATRVGDRYFQGAYWGTCTATSVGLSDQQHFQRVPWATSGIDPAFIPTRCHRCGAAWAGEKCWGFASTDGRYDTPTGELSPGCMYWASTTKFGSWSEGWKHSLDGIKCFDGWTNCDGRHLIVMLPNSRHWDINSRASNCGLPDDTVHRCWIRHGEPPNVTVDKAGQTCQAGAGSIQSGDWHGFLRAGELVVA